MNDSEKKRPTGERRSQDRRREHRRSERRFPVGGDAASDRRRSNRRQGRPSS